MTSKHVTIHCQSVIVNAHLEIYIAKSHKEMRKSNLSISCNYLFYKCAVSLELAGAQRWRFYLKVNETECLTSSFRPHLAYWITNNKAIKSLIGLISLLPG